MLITPSRHAAFPLACLVVLTFHLNPRALAFAQQTSVKPLETTITELVASSRKFSGKRVHVRAQEGTHLNLPVNSAVMYLSIVPRSPCAKARSRAWLPGSDSASWASKGTTPRPH